VELVEDPENTDSSVHLLPYLNNAESNLNNAGNNYYCNNYYCISPVLGVVATAEFAKM